MEGEEGLAGSPRPKKAKKAKKEKKPKKEKKEKKATETPEIRKITNAKKVFSTINEGSALSGWPSEEIKKAAGKSGWGEWVPEAGMEGEVVHSWGAKRHLLKVDGKYCVVGE